MNAEAMNAGANEETPREVSTVDIDLSAADIIPAGMVQVGENYIGPSTSRSREHIDLPVSQTLPGRIEMYDNMVTRDGFPMKASEDVDPSAPETV